MRILTGQGVTHTLLQSAPDELQEASRDERVQGAPGGTDGGIEPNRQFPDLFLRFVSSVAQFEHQAQRPGGPQALAAVDLSAVTSKYIGETEKNVDVHIGRQQIFFGQEFENVRQGLHQSMRTNPQRTRTRLDVRQNLPLNPL